MRLIFSTCSEREAEGLVRQLLEERLIGCANVVPRVRSLYRWEGGICDDTEVVLFMESPADLVDRACARLGELHSYDVPKIIVLEPERVNAEYRAWLIDEATGDHGSRPVGSADGAP